MLQLLESQGWSIKPDAYQELVEEAEGNVPSVLQNIFHQDLKKIGKAALPDDVNRTTTTIKGPVVLQISSVADISRPSLRESSAGGGNDRLLCVRLTDGKVTCKAIEYQRVELLSEELAPGTKVLLTNATVKNGIVLLNPKCIKVLGGRVEHLAAAWETQRRYGGVERPRAAGGPAGSEGEMAPPFRHFVPGRDDKAAKLSGHTTTPTTIPTTTRSAPPATSAAAAAATVAAAVATATAAAAATTTAAAAAAAKGTAAAAAAPPATAAPPPAAAALTFSGGAAGEAARRRLQEQLEAREEARGRFGRFGGGRGGGRGFRRGRRGDDDEDDGGGGVMTLEEYEAAQKAKAAAAAAGPRGVAQLEEDEALARRLQAELDLEASYYSRPEGGTSQQAASGSGYGGYGNRNTGYGGGGGRGGGGGGR
ncbi:hypothetical protein Agub_g15893, partial [Astrephomene gubernaculifera]